MAYRIGRPGEGAHEGAFVLGEAGERISWGAIIAGVFAALAVQILFALVGLSLGFVAADAADEAAPFFLIFAGLASLFCGGFIAGRMAGVPLLPSAVLHGALVWSVVTVLSAIMALGGAATVAGGAARIAAGVGEAAVDAAGGVAALLPEDVSSVVPEDVERDLREAMGDTEMSAREMRDEARAVFTSVIDENDRDRIGTILRETGRAVLTDPANADAALASGLDRIAGARGVIGEAERQELIAALSTRFDVSEEQATAVVERWGASIETAAAEARQTLETLREDAKRLAEEAAETAAGAAAAAALALFLGLFGACAGALLGRPEDVLSVEVAEARAHGA